MDLPRTLTPDDIRGLTVTQLDAFLDLVAAIVLADGQISEGERAWVEQKLVHGVFAGTDIQELYRHLEASLGHFRAHGHDLQTYIAMAKAQLQPLSPGLAETIMLTLIQISESDQNAAAQETAVVRAVSAALGVGKERMSVVVGAATGAVIFPPIARGELEVVQMLLDNGTAIDTRDHNQWTPLHVAVATGGEPIVAMLLERGAPIEALHNQGSTPLFCACNKPYAAIVRRLLAKGANPNAQNAQTQLTPLAVAVAFDQSEVVGALLAGGAITTLADADGKTPLHLAAEGDRTAIAQQLIDAGADVNAADRTGATPVHRAAMNNPATLAVLLAKPGVDVNRQDPRGVTPLAEAAREGFTACVQQLLDKGARVDLANVEGGTPMFLATIHRRRDVHDLLAARGGVAAGTVSQAKAGPLEAIEWDPRAAIAVVPVVQALADWYDRQVGGARLLRSIAEHRGWHVIDRVKAPDGQTLLLMFTTPELLAEFRAQSPWLPADVDAKIVQRDGVAALGKLEGVDLVGVDHRPADPNRSIYYKGADPLATLVKWAQTVEVERAIAAPVSRDAAAIAARFFGYQQVVSMTTQRPFAIAHPMGRTFVPIFTSDDTFAAMATAPPSSVVTTVGKQVFDIGALDCDGAIVNPFGPTIPKILSLEAAAKLFAG